MIFDNFVKALAQFEYRLDSKEKVWDIIVPDHKNKFHYLKVIKYEKTFYIVNVDGDLPTLEITPGQEVKVDESRQFHRHINNPNVAWNDLVVCACKWLDVVKKDWIKSNKKVHELYPLNRRYGLVSNAFVRLSLSDIYQINKELGKTKTKKFIKLVEEGYFSRDESTTRKSMTVNDYFDYCKIAYIAGQRKDDFVDSSLSGRAMYERYADGRDEGLLEVAENSEQEFADWIDGKHPKKTKGGHPWEIKRGGNTTHIDLFVSRPQYYSKEGFTINLRGRSIARLKETICMFLAIYDAGLPITIDDPEGIRRRLLAQDNLGIIPCFDSLHRASQRYHEDQDVYDVLYYDDLGRYKSRIKPFITWEPLPILMPKNICF